MNSGYSETKEKVNLVKSKDKYENLKSNHLVKNLFNALEKKKTLDIIKYNKNIMKRLNININDYKKCSEKYSSIEVEIKPVVNKYSKFINIADEDKIYYHIYFNNKEEEIKRNCINIDDQIKIIKIRIDYHIKSFHGLFDGCNCIESINFKKFLRNNIENMSYMFYGCSSLKTIDLSNFITNNVTDMDHMFYDCSSLNEINLNNFNTNNVKNMSHMFGCCSSLKELNLNNFCTNNVTDMDHFFYGCSSLNELNLNNFNTNNVTNMNSMFCECSSLKELNLNNFNTNNVTDMENMFSKCLSLKDLKLDSFNTTNVTYIYDMFSGCSIELIEKVKSLYKNIKEEAF